MGFPIAFGTHGTTSTAVTAGASEVAYNPSSGIYVALADWNSLQDFTKTGLCAFVEGADVTAGVFASPPTEIQAGIVVNTTTGAQLTTAAGLGIWAIMWLDGVTYKLQFYTGALDSATLTVIPAGITAVDLRFPVRYATADVQGSFGARGLTFQSMGWSAQLYAPPVVDALEITTVSASATLTTAVIQAPNQLTYVDTSSVVVTLPASPADGSTHSIKIAGGVTSCSVTPNGTETTDGIAGAYPVGSNFSGTWHAVTGGWLVL